MEQKKTPDYYSLVFSHIAKILRILHRDLHFGFITIVLQRSHFEVRWTVRKKGCKKYVHSIPITFDSLISLSSTEVYKLTEEIAHIAKDQLPKELRND